MGKDCCGAKEEALIQLRSRQSRTLKIVLAINFTMFLVEFTFGLIAQSSALLADSMDMLGDAAVYAFSLFVLYKSARWRAGAALMKGLIMLAFGLGVLGEAIYKAFNLVTPDAPTIGIVGAIAMAANLSCLFLLLKHKEDDINMRSTWICSRNDIIANAGVLLAAVGVALTQNKWPDIAIGVAIAGVFLRSSVQVLSEAYLELKRRPGTAS